MQEAAPSEGDAFGQLLLQCWRDGGRTGVAHEIVERDDGFIGLSDAATYFAGPDEWQAPERAGLEHIVGRVLDVGCGAGRHAVVRLRVPVPRRAHRSDCGLAVASSRDHPWRTGVRRCAGTDALVTPLDEGRVGDDVSLVLERVLVDVSAARDEPKCRSVGRTVDLDYRKR